MNIIGTRQQVDLIHVWSGIARPGTSPFHSDESMLGLLVRSAAGRQPVSREHHAVQHQEGRWTLRFKGLAWDCARCRWKSTTAG